MPETFKVVAQVDPPATTLTDAYTVLSTQFVGKVRICNRGGATTYRVSQAVGGAVDDNKQYLAYDTAIGANTNDEIRGIQLQTADKIRVYAGANTLSFNIIGDEIT